MTETRGIGTQKPPVYTGKLVRVGTRRLVGSGELRNTISLVDFYARLRLVVINDNEKAPPSRFAKWIESRTEKLSTSRHVGPQRYVGRAVKGEEVPKSRMSAQEVLKELLGGAMEADRRRCLVILAETLDYTRDEERQLAPALWRFIVEKRDSNDADELVAVCAAIRKYLGIANLSEVGHLAVLLEPGHPLVLPLEAQLEVVKMIARKFAANPPALPSPEPLLADRVADLALAYLNPYVLSDAKYAAVAMNALQGLAGMLSPKFGQAMEALDTVGCEWFRNQLRRRLLRVLSQWEKEPLQAQRMQAVDGLRRLVDCIPSN